MLWMLPARFQFEVTALVAIVASFSCFAETGERRDLNRNRGRLCCFQMMFALETA